MNAIQVIDIVLETIVKTDKSPLELTEGAIFETIIKTYPDLNREGFGKEFVRIIKRLKSDEYIIQKEFTYTINNNWGELESTETVVSFDITFDGALFYEQGGYAGELRRQNAESIRVATLAETQRVNANRMTYLTTILAVFAVLSVLIQSIKELHWVLSIQFWTAFLLFSSGILTGVCILLIVQEVSSQKRNK